jgi:CHRD domain
VRASGRLTATLNGSKLAWKLTFEHLTGKATAAHIHIAKRGKAGPVAIPLCGPCTSGMSRTSVVTSAQVNARKKGDAYVNVHTVKNAAGEIRGQIRG